MMWDHLPVFLLLVHFASCFPREKTTEKPEIPLVVNSKQRRPTHISEFTDPDTGLNPFLDLEEGRTSSEGRNVMEDERRDDQPYFDFDLVEGDAPDRRWNLEEPREPVERIPYRQPQPDFKNYDDFHVVTTARIIPPNPPTTVEAYVTKDMGKVMSEDAEESTKTQHKVTKEEKESLSVSQSIVIYATTAIALMTIAVLLIGACWWRRKLKTSQSSTATVENGEVKS